MVDVDPGKSRSSRTSVPRKWTMHNVFGKSGVTMLSGGAVAKSVPVALVVEFQISVTSDFVGELRLL